MPTVLVRVPRDRAQGLARTLVDERLAAAVNRVPCRSVYRWDDAVHGDDEEILLAQTTDDACDALVDRIETLHPYEVPSIERFDETEAPERFLAWRRESVRDERSDGE